jgi:acetyl esterase/lipase
LHYLKHTLLWSFLAMAALAILAACAPVATLNALSPADTHTLRADVPYGPLPRHRLDIYTPTSAAPAGGYPVVVFFYGGSWNRGERHDYKFVGEALASKGMLAILADYRLYPQVRYPDFLTDCAQALAYGLSHAKELGGNPQRVFVMGHSAGAYNAAMLAMDPRWLQATGHSTKELAGFIGLAGPYDFYPMTNPDAQPVFFHPHYPPDSQPIAFAGQGSPRAFVAAPQDDKLVNPHRNTEGMAHKFQAAGAKVTLKMYDRVNHMTLAAAFARPLRWLAPVLDDVTAFVDGA